MEIFKDIEGYEGLYQITSWGRVYSLRYKTFLIPEPTTKGYLRVYLYSKNGKRKHYKVHRLVANAFVTKVAGKDQVNHIDGNKANNSFTNLEWCTNEENASHRKFLKEIASVSSI